MRTGEYRGGGTTYGSHDARGALAEVLPAHPRDGAVGGHAHLVLARAGVEEAEVEREALAVYALAQDGVREPALAEVRLGVEVRLHDRGDAARAERERGVVHARDAAAARGVDGRGVVLDAERVRDGRVRDEQERGAARKGGVEGRGRAEVAVPHLDACGEHLGRRAVRVVQRDDDVRGCGCGCGGSQPR